MQPEAQLHKKTLKKTRDRVKPEDLFQKISQNSKYEQTLGRLEEALADMQPFTVTLQSFDLFRNKKNATLWLSPETSPDRMALDKLQLALQAYEKKKYMQKKNWLRRYMCLIPLSIRVSSY